MPIDPFKNLSPQEHKLFESLSTPAKIQDYLDSIHINFERHGDTNMSPRMVIKTKRAHCMEGAMLAAAALWYHDKEPFLLDLRTAANDFDHVVALFKEHSHWGAISKTNHAVLRYREPIYKTIRELALSYFHEYFVASGLKTLREYSHPFSLKYLAKTDWLITKEDLWDVAEALDNSKHYYLINAKQVKTLRKAHPTEIQAGKISQYKRI